MQALSHYAAGGRLRVALRCPTIEVRALLRRVGSFAWPGPEIFGVAQDLKGSDMGSTDIDMKALTSRQLEIARTVAATLFETDASKPLPPERLDFAIEELRDFTARAGIQTRMAFNAAFIVVQLAPLLFLGKLRRFTRLSAIARKRCIQKLESSRLGLVMVLLKTVLSFVYFEHPDALASTGYDAEGLLGPAWAVGGRSPIAKLPLRVIDNPIQLETDEPERGADVVPAPVVVSHRAAGGS